MSEKFGVFDAVVQILKKALYSVMRVPIHNAIMDASVCAVLTYYSVHDVPLAPKSVFPDVVRLAGAYGQKEQKHTYRFVRSYLS